MAKNAQTAKAEKKSIFWIMQYSTPFLEVYESFKKKLGRKYRFVAPLENRNQIGILSKIIPEIIAADFVIADVSTIGYDANDNERPLYNGNVMFELGVAMAYRKNLIMISSATRKGLPFDISGYHVNEYVDSHLHMEKFIGEIRKILDNENTVYRNPVSDLDHTYTLITNSELEALKAALPTAASNTLPVNQPALPSCEPTPKEIANGLSSVARLLLSALASDKSNGRAIISVSRAGSYVVCSGFDYPQTTSREKAKACAALKELEEKRLVDPFGNKGMVEINALGYDVADELQGPEIVVIQPPKSELRKIVEKGFGPTR